MTVRRSPGGEPPSLEALEAHSRLDGHEALCGERYMNINRRLERIERILFWLFATLITTMLGMIGGMVFFWAARVQIIVPT